MRKIFCGTSKLFKKGGGVEFGPDFLFLKKKKIGIKKIQLRQKKTA